MSLDIQSISLDISKQPTPQQVRLGQGDANATQLIVSVFDDGETYSLDDYTVRLALRLPNDGGYYNVNGTKSGNVATFDIDEQYAASVSGFDGFGYVDIMDGETVICSTSRFQLVVLQNASDGVELAPQYIDAVQDAIDRANAAAEAAEGIVLQDVPLMSATVRGGAQLGDGLSIVDGKLTATGESYELPTMSATTKGGAKLGSGLSVTNDTLSLSGESYTSAEKTKLAGIEDGANNYTLPTMDASTKGGAKLGAGLSVANDVLSVDASSISAGALPIAHGGTGATSASDALANLGIIAPCAITAHISEAMSLTTSYQQINLAAGTIIGSYLSVVNNQVKCSQAGTVRVSGQVYFSGVNDTNVCNARVYKNTSAVSQSTTRSSGERVLICISPFFLQVSANDVLHLDACNSSTAVGQLENNANYTYLTVEYVI